MDTFASVMGWIVIAAVALIVAAILCGVVTGLLLRVMDWLKEKGAMEERTRLHRNLLAGAHWFSEHPPTSELMRIYANSVVLGGESMVSDIRDEWRRHLTLQRQNEEGRPF